ncbi:tetratricopeptide repeat-containing sensor histidine kinase [uncultured Tenacibaculum sp.]|uniref:tetratricopeptide repeat-containing sensor histidine kinase n=1 Tax=uncultured Tenacibaculum sp. TaxID=174713 RepID=UPI00263761EF|nr:tetratricopeptide repeat-containing sensor histidine kinase [uncultured Tenacibaculum sp.]
MKVGLCFSSNNFIQNEKKYLSNKNSHSSISKDSLKIKLKIAKDLFNKKEYNKSLEQSLLLLPKTQNDLEVKLSLNFLVGDIFRETNNHDKAIYHYKEVLKLFNKKSLEKKLFSKNSNISLNLIHLRLGGEYYANNKKDSSIFYYKKILGNSNITTNDQIIKASAYTNLSGLYREDSIYDLAKDYSLKAIDIYKSNNRKISGAAAYGNLASIFLEEKNYLKAKQIYLEGLDLIQKDTSYNSTKYKEYLYFNLAYTLYLLKDYRAYDYQEKSYNIKDDLRDIEIRRILEEIYAKQEVDLEKEKTALVEEQRKLIEAKDSKATLLLGVLTFLILLISGVVVYNYKLRQKNLHLKLSESNLLQQQSIEKLKSEAQIKILNATIDGKESERKLIAETLHDNVSALLSSANMHLSATKKQHNGNTPIEVEKTRAIILEASQKVRDLSHNLVSSILLKFGLEYAIKDVAKKYSNSQLNFEVSAKNVNRYNQDFEIKIFNIIQELINNIIKHSKANHAKIALKEEKNQLTILIRDDGVGFTPSSSSIKDGIGLNQIDARIHVLNGKFIISSELNKGTEAIITVPIQQQKKEFKLTSVS